MISDYSMVLTETGYDKAGTHQADNQKSGKLEMLKKVHSPRLLGVFFFWTTLNFPGQTQHVESALDVSLR